MPGNYPLTLSTMRTPSGERRRAPLVEVSRVPVRFEPAEIGDGHRERRNWLSGRKRGQVPVRVLSPQASHCCGRAGSRCPRHTRCRAGSTRAGERRWKTGPDAAVRMPRTPGRGDCPTARCASGRERAGHRSGARNSRVIRIGRAAFGTGQHRGLRVSSIQVRHDQSCAVPGLSSESWTLPQLP
jgi:hypothetical protein